MSDQQVGPPPTQATDTASTKRPWYRTGKGIAGIVVVVVVVLAAIGSTSKKDSGSEATATPSAAPSASPVAASSGSAPAEATAAATASAIASQPDPTEAPVEGDHGIVFDKPVLFGGALPTVGVLMTNTTDQVMTFTVKTTFLDGDTILGTAVGAVNDFLPKTKRAVSLLVDGQTKGATKVETAIDTLISSTDETDASRAAVKITFGPPTLSTLGLDSRVTNGDDVAHSMTVSAAVLRKGVLVGIATGAVNDIGAGQTKTTTFLLNGDGSKSDQYLFYVDALIK